MDEFLKINVGQVVTILVVLGGIVGVWFKMRWQLEALSEKIRTQETVIREFESKGVILVLGQHEARLIKLEALQLTLGLMQTDIALIKQSLNQSRRDQQIDK
jgi:uncharacterized membrane protein YqgA involved in biofilm formation